MVSTQNKNTVEYSEADISLLSLLGTKPINSKELVKQFYEKRTADPPRNGQQSVSSMMRSLIVNVELNGGAIPNRKGLYKIVSTPRSGPIPMKYWLVKR